MRDRLETLILESDILCRTCGENTDSYCAEFLADYLLKKGVIVPPCKVGDTVYLGADEYKRPAVIEEIHITQKGMYFEWAQYDISYEITECWDEGDFDIDDIGKTVFLSREEAEAALKVGESSE